MKKRKVLWVSSVFERKVWNAQNRSFLRIWKKHWRLRGRYALLVILIIASSVSAISAQTAEQYHRLFREYENAPYRFDKDHIVDELKRYFGAYSLHDSMGYAIQLYLKTCAEAMNLDPKNALILFCKASQIYDWGPIRQGYYRNLFFELLFKGGLFHGVDLTEEQRSVLSDLYLKQPTEFSLERRSYELLRSFYHIRSKSLANELLESYEWFLINFPNSTKTDSVRFFMAELLSMAGKHNLASGYYFSVYLSSRTDDFARSALLKATEEVLQRPIWDYERAVAYLKLFLKSFGQEYWPIPLLRLIEIYTLRLKQPSQAFPFLKIFLRDFREELDGNEDLMENVLRNQIEYWRKQNDSNKMCNLAKEYLALFPLTKFAKKVQIYWEESCK